MADLESTKTAALEQNQLHEEEEFIKKLKLSLPKQEWFDLPMHLYQDFWCTTRVLEPNIAFQTHFQAEDTDIIMACLPKTGTTWLKSLLFTTVNRNKHSDFSHQHPLHTKNPHELVPHFQFLFCNINGAQPDLTEMQTPRLFATHLPYSALPESIKSSNCPIVYLCRNPLDTFVSAWHFSFQLGITSKNINDPEIVQVMLEEHVAKYCTGVFPFGPYDEHVLGYWKESLENTQKVLFLEYEGLKKEPRLHVKRLAEFLGCPFSEEEEEGNVIEDIIELCSLKSLKDMEVNRSGKFIPWVENKVYNKSGKFTLWFDNKHFFRKGEVGDWNNVLTPEMAKSIDQITEKLVNNGFSFTYYQPNLQL